MSAVARAVTMVAVFLQSLFNWDKEDEVGGGGMRGRAVGYHLAGLVLARGGSKGIPRKNLVEVGGRPLIQRALDEMIKSGVFTTIWISTDDDEIRSWVRGHYPKGAVAVHSRAAYTATDGASSISAVLEFLGHHPEVDAVGLVQATSPFLKSQFLIDAFHKFANGQKYDSVFAATRLHHLRWSPEGSEGKNERWTKPINFNPRSRPRRQDWKGEMVENGMFYFATRSVLVNYGVFQGEKSGYVEIPEHLSLEIDTWEDLEIARCLALKFDLDEDGDNKGNKNQLRGKGKVKEELGIMGSLKEERRIREL